MSQPRRRSRQLALMLLFSKGFDESQDLNTVARTIFNDDHRDELGDFGWSLVNGISAHLTQIDEKIALALQNWKLSRLSLTDKCVLRLGVYEVIWGVDVPPRVAIDESVELAKVFGTEDSPSFVNGILDKIAKDAHPSLVDK